MNIRVANSGIPPENLLDRLLRSIEIGGMSLAEWIFMVLTILVLLGLFLWVIGRLIRLFGYLKTDLPAKRRAKQAQRESERREAEVAAHQQAKEQWYTEKAEQWMRHHNQRRETFSLDDYNDWSDRYDWVHDEINGCGFPLDFEDPKTSNLQKALQLLESDDWKSVDLLELGRRSN